MSREKQNSFRETIRIDCPMRHETGNCLVSGGFCTAVNTPICEALHNAYNAGKTHSIEEMKKQGYRKQSEWISVEERLPEITETVLIAYKEKWEWEAEWTFDVDVGSLDITGREWNTYHDLYEGQELHITHWMPLPEPPKKGGGEG